MIRDDQPFDVVVYNRSATFHGIHRGGPCGYCKTPGAGAFWLGTQYVCLACYADHLGRPFGQLRDELEAERDLDARIYEEKLGGPQVIGPDALPPAEPDDIPF